jgi:transcriptional regulator with XRE-family HTH domain
MEKDFKKIVEQMVAQLSIDEVATVLGVSSRSIRNYIKGEMPTDKVQRKLSNLFLKRDPSGTYRIEHFRPKSDQEIDYKEKYYSLLEEWKEMTQSNQSEQEERAMILAYVRTIFHYQAELRSVVMKKDAADLMKEMGKTLNENYRNVLKKDKPLV